MIHAQLSEYVELLSNSNLLKNHKISEKLKKTPENK